MRGTQLSAPQTGGDNRVQRNAVDQGLRDPAETAAAPATAGCVKWVGMQTVIVSATAPSISPGCSNPMGEMRIGAPLVSPQSPVVRGSSPAFSALTPRRVLGPT